MNILIVITNRYRNPVPVMPIGACSVAEAAEKAGYRVRVLDLMFERDPLGVLKAKLEKLNPDIVVFQSETSIITTCKIQWRFLRS